MECPGLPHVQEELANIKQTIYLFVYLKFCFVLIIFVILIFSFILSAYFHFLLFFLVFVLFSLFKEMHKIWYRGRWEVY